MAGATHRNHAHQPRHDHYAEITDQIVGALAAGTPPWRKPWNADKAGGPSLPLNAATGPRYRGINVLTLGLSPLAFANGDPRWCTYRQAAERGWQVRKGERGTTAFFYKRLEVSDAASVGDDPDATRVIPLLRSFTLFHASQIEGIEEFVPLTVEEAPWRTPEALDTIVANSSAVVLIGGDRAFYSTATASIQMPPAAAFSTVNGYASTLAHELGHWTAGPTRLARDMRNRLGSPDYAREEVRVELAQAMICAETGIHCEFNEAASYIASWLETLRSDRREVFRAAADAQRIADYLLALHPDWAASVAPAAEQVSANDDGTPILSDGMEPAVAA